MGYVVAETTSWAHPQKGSLNVVIGNGPVYNPANDVPFHRKAQFFVNQESVLVQQKSWQVSPSGLSPPVTSDVQRITQAKVFEQYQEFPQAWKSTPLSTTNFLQGNADIFKGQDTYGWPELETSYWCPPQPVYNTVINTAPAYNWARDVFLLKPQAKFFDQPQEYFTPQKPLPQSLTTYLVYQDFSWVKGQAKWFDPPQEYFKASQPVTINANAITNFTPYNPATDVTLLKPQAKVFSEPEVFWNGQPITQNVLINIAPPYNPATMFLFRQQDREYPAPDETWFDFKQKVSPRTVTDTQPITGEIVAPNVVGMYFYDAQLAILQAGFLIAPPILVGTTETTVLGIVLSQSIPPGALYPSGSQVQITITVAAYLTFLPPLTP